MKYNYLGADVPTAVESMTVSLKNPWTVHVTVREKEMLGYVDYDGAFLYFDRDGTACLRTKEVLDGVPHIEGLVFDVSKVELGSVLPVEDSGIFRRIMDATVYIAKIQPCPGTGSSVLTAVSHCISAGVEVLLGEDNYEARLATGGTDP